MAPTARSVLRMGRSITTAAPLLQRRPRSLDERPVEHALQIMVLADGTARRAFARILGLLEKPREIEAARLPMLDRPGLIDEFGGADDLVERADAQARPGFV